MCPIPYMWNAINQIELNKRNVGFRFNNFYRFGHSLFFNFVFSFINFSLKEIVQLVDSSINFWVL